MKRKMYEPTANQEIKFAANDNEAMPTDAEFKTNWKASPRGTVRGWGMAKRDWALRHLRHSGEYQRGLWQGRVDKARELPYSEERSAGGYNLGYYMGYDEYESNRRGWDKGTRARFDEKYLGD